MWEAKFNLDLQFMIPLFKNKQYRILCVTQLKSTNANMHYIQINKRTWIFNYIETQFGKKNKYHRSSNISFQSVWNAFFALNSFTIYWI